MLKLWVKILVKIQQKRLGHAKESATDALKTTSEKSNSKDSRSYW